MIQTVCEDGRVCPVVFCESCGKRIEKAGDGLAVIVPGESIVFYHKSWIDASCDKARSRPWIDIDILFLQLLHNLNVDIDATMEKARLLSEL